MPAKQSWLTLEKESASKLHKLANLEPEKKWHFICQLPFLFVWENSSAYFCDRMWPRSTGLGNENIMPWLLNSHVHKPRSGITYYSDSLGSASITLRQYFTPSVLIDTGTHFAISSFAKWQYFHAAATNLPWMTVTCRYKDRKAVLTGKQQV